MGRVLVVDDDTDVRSALVMLLEADGHSVVELDDGLKVLDMISDHGVDVILLDISMPHVDGFEVLSMLMLDPSSAGVPVVVISARGRPSDKAQAMALGASDYVNKPWGDGEVEFRVRMALGRSERKWAEENKKPGENPPVRPAAPQPQPSAPIRSSRPAQPVQPPAPAPQAVSPAAPHTAPAAHKPASRPLRRRPRVRRIVRRIRRRAA
ncbi:MAG: response regulator [Chloroflexi bacterium]|nr:response regulator [Chloroflexota bacterium]